MSFLVTAGGESSVQTESLSRLKTKTKPLTKIDACRHKTLPLKTEQSLIEAAIVNLCGKKKKNK